MQLKLDDIAPLYDADALQSSRRAVVRTRAKYDRLRPSRREFVAGALAAGTAIGMTALGIFPPARPAAAQHGSWKIWSGCDGLGSWVNDDNCRGCNQGSRLCCCSNGYHKGPGAGCHYKHRPDQCKSGGYDGWTWKVGSCCIKSCGTCCSLYKNMAWRCSDGYYRSSCCAGCWTKSICRKRVNGGQYCSKVC